LAFLVGDDHGINWGLWQWVVRLRLLSGVAVVDLLGLGVGVA